MSDIVLTTLNARYIHSSLGLRYLLANLGSLEKKASIVEFIIDKRPIDVVEQLLALQPKIIGLGVYIWNVEQCTQIVALLKQIRPDITIVIGGPEVSYEQPSQQIFQLADYAVSGPGENSFHDLCLQLLDKQRPNSKIIPSSNRELKELNQPYDYYTDEDVAHRIIYVEASRGCPFKCEFCLSALDKTAKPFDIDLFLAAMERLYQRGVRHFKFVDRTFNLKIAISVRIMRFFRTQCPDAFLHFELIPDHLPKALKEEITAFSQDKLQFEIGIQSFNPEVQSLISRKQNNKKTCENLAWLRTQSHAHLHTDLILGLPGEDLASIEQGFNKLASLNPHEIQVGILKRLKGTPIIRHTDTYKMRYNPHPPFNVLATDRIDFETMQRLNRFARYWDMIANSGRFKHTMPLVLQGNAFTNFLQLTDWLFETTGQTHKISLPRLFELLYKGVTQTLLIDKALFTKSLLEDFKVSGIKGRAKFLDTANSRSEQAAQQSFMQRQTRHTQK